MKPTYSENFEERRNKVNELLEEYSKRDSNFLIKAVYNSTNIENNVGKYSPEKLSETTFSKCSNQNLLFHFGSTIFPIFENDVLQDLFQEVYNRQSKQKGCEPRYIVKYDEYSLNVNGYIQPNFNKLFINSAAVDNYRDVLTPDTETNRYKYNLGANTLLSVIHETEHTYQYEGVMRFLLNEETSSSERAKDALVILKEAIGQSLNYHYEDGFEPDDYFEMLGLYNHTYKFDLQEHDANMATVRFLKDNLKKGHLPDKSFTDTMEYRIKRNLYIDKTPEDKIETDLSERLLQMEKILNRFIESFETNFENGELKKQILQVVKPYMQVDNKGNSPFRKDMNNDFNMCLNFLKECENKRKNGEIEFLP